MRLIAVLLSLLIVGLLVYRQLQGTPGVDSTVDPEAERTAAPRVPTAPKHLPAFEQQMQDAVEEQAAQRAAAVDAAERGD
ncbi:MAG: hypothetical protein CME40_13915 [Haliea sp.]|nr:hypothetical protein [Haliea sp.]|tara:strand:- start:102336 stop:102575 length:240 start_codon:yes stop_codon:yes gene_type:complete